MRLKIFETRVECTLNTQIKHSNIFHILLVHKLDTSSKSNLIVPAMRPRPPTQILHNSACDASLSTPTPPHL